MSVRWGIIGAGGIARRRSIPEVVHYAKESTVVSVMDVEERVLREIAQTFSIPYATTSVEELLRSDCEAVYIASPVFAHSKQCKDALKAGKHVLVEKPMAMKVEEAEEIIALAEEKRLKLGVAFMMRYNVYHRLIKRMIGEGKLGTVVGARAQLTCWYPPLPGAWRQKRELGGGGSLADMGCHCIDLLEWFLGEAQEVIASTASTVHPYEVEDTATALLRFPNGAQGIVDTFFNVPDEASRNVLEIYGTLGAVLCRRTIGQDGGGEMEVFLKEAEGGYNAAQVRTADGFYKVNLDPKPLYAEEFDAMSVWIQGGEKPLIHSEIGLRNLKVVEAAYTSSRTKRWVEIR
ncbi:MAG: Gfo/Idh/MocA family oxidoreductase [Atribacterota bacterium]